MLPWTREVAVDIAIFRAEVPLSRSCANCDASGRSNSFPASQKQVWCNAPKKQEGQMNHKGSLITGTVLAVMLGTGLTAAVPGMGVRTAGADSLQDVQLQESLGAEFFRVDWSAKPDGHGKTRITGYVYSDKGRAADEVQLHISELDASGKQVGSYFERMLESVPAEGRGHFDVKVPINAKAASYHVAVYSWNDVEGGTKEPHLAAPRAGSSPLVS